MGGGGGGDGDIGGGSEQGSVSGVVRAPMACIAAAARCALGDGLPSRSGRQVAWEEAASAEALMNLIRGRQW